MSKIEWKLDPSPLHMLEGGESAIVGDWRLRIDRLKEHKPSKLLDNLMGALSEKERKVLNMRDAEYEEKERQRERRKEGDKTHPYMWNVEHVHDDDPPKHFSHMGGRAATAEEAKTLAVAAVKYAGLIFDALKMEST
jgi:hypothetical protein